MAKELTKMQTVSLVWDDQLPTELPKSFDTYRTIRAQPTIALVRALSTAAITSGSWTVEPRDDDTPEEWVEFIEQMFVGLREPLYVSALENGTDFGYAGFEKVFSLLPGDKASPTARIQLSKLKPLLVDLTTILVQPQTGLFAGFEQQRDQVTVPVKNSFLLPFRMEGTNWYGTSLLENARLIYDKWLACDDGAARYDKRTAGSHWVVTYPYGEAVVDGVVVANDVTASAILTSLQSSGGVTIPRTVANTISELNADNNEQLSWKIELLSDSTPRQPSFIDRLNYLDKCMVRALLWPERAMLEGQFGTKAEAGTHKDLALINAELTDRFITRMVNWHCVDQILAINFGEKARGTVFLEASPLIDRSLEALQAVYDKVLANNETVIAEYAQMDMKVLRGRVGVPTDPDAEEDPLLPVGAKVEDPDDLEAIRERATTDKKKAEDSKDVKEKVGKAEEN